MIFLNILFVIFQALVLAIVITVAYFNPSPVSKVCCIVCACTFLFTIINNIITDIRLKKIWRQKTEYTSHAAINAEKESPDATRHARIISHSRKNSQ